MDEIRGSEWFVLIAMMVHLIMAPGTKVEESFNMQATHDLLYHGTNLSQYDHHSFPGVVPRTFVGPLCLAVLVSPLRFFSFFVDIMKIYMLYAVRFALGGVVVCSFLYFARTIEKHFGRESAMFLRVLVATQFHFLFYASRTLPNTFAVPIVLYVMSLWMEDKMERAATWATVATLLFRCELVLLFAPLFLPSLLNGRIRFFPLFSSQSAQGIFVLTAIRVLLFSVPLDSLMWRRPLWPEAEVALFNVIDNRSHEYGTAPFHWYFSSSLPRALLGSILLLPVAPLFDRRLISLILPPLFFIFLYSFLPHKELRFIIYVFPILTVPAAVLCARFHINSEKSWFRWFLSFAPWLLVLSNVIACMAFVSASSRNYPGADAIAYIQYSQRIDAHKPRSVFIDEFSAQNGVSRFYQLYDAWEYNKTENLAPEDYQRFDFLLIGSTGNLKEVVQSNFSTHHRVMVVVPAFAGFKWNKLSSFPYYFPELRMKERIAVMKKKDE